MARANKGMGGGVAGNRAGPDGHQSPGKPGETTETDRANEKMGNFGEQGPSEEKLSNERDATPDVKQDADKRARKAFELMDKDKRADEELGKGRRHSSEHPYNDSKDNS